MASAMPKPLMATPSPCVFCGSVEARGSIDGEARFVVCGGCGARGPRVVANDNGTAHEKWSRAILAWNREVKS